MSRKETEKKASDYFDSGFNCAESVLKATMESRVDNVSPELPKIASALGGGVGGSHEELCGALSGGVLAIGLLYGRTEPEVDVQFAKDLATEFRARFLKEFGTTKCGVLLERFGEQDNDDKCAELTGAAAALLSDLLDEQK
ncbi:MAG: C_GCAxxG_C_C family protein [Candidatus Zixiibacteriota bacterium]|nr:MAG: C_GCAxxG_C_C family protein [candidate division Zixibacteria bacterium]